MEEACDEAGIAFERESDDEDDWDEDDDDSDDDDSDDDGFPFYGLTSGDIGLPKTW